ncbi:hypothetical protein NCCP2716_11700 [Sporosarcina sp. NCCP-2716]|uniref:hypothetical protein n=1 Tax=Sporosarcina sp. NCCP-2716 TaxID=2943679 RepID=UPI00203B3B6E|nr:hypothetical protein [Sporosarcina sp. NCCP-2716]GKV68672.1 hypothetical protein NCCP2716_11700 [Sporosarcina sp. NCCP-2716]
MTANRKNVTAAAVIGLLSGLVLTFLFKWTEAVTGEKIYTLLLNVDYIPIFGEVSYPEWLEVAFHLIVSVAVAFGFLLMYRLRPQWHRHAVPICTAVSVLIGILLFPTTALSDRTPAITDGTALLYWLIGHAIFGALLGIGFRRLGSK